MNNLQKKKKCNSKPRLGCCYF